MIFFPSTLVINCSINQIIPLISKIGHHQITNNPDIFEVGEYTIGAIREINKFLAVKPLSHDSKIILIQDADKLNIESQNALLKNLEEPGENSYFILTTSKPYSLLPTIVSRCHLIRYPATITHQDKPLTIPQPINKRLILAEQLASDRSSTVEYLESLLRISQKELTTKPSPATSTQIKKILKTISLVKANIDPKTALDYLLLSSN